MVPDTSSTEYIGLQSTGDWKGFELDAKLGGQDTFNDGLPGFGYGLIANNPAQTVSFEVTPWKGSIHRVLSFADLGSIHRTPF